MTTQPKIAIITMVIGADFAKAMEPGIQTKRNYAQKHGYDLHIGGKEVWDRSRPIPWSKLLYIQKFIDMYDYLFWSDADVIITNPDISLITHVLPLLPPNKDLLWTRDVCGNLNSGNMLLRGKSAWLKDFITRTYQQIQFIHHIWWENKAMIHTAEQNPQDAAKIETITNYSLFNSYLFGPKNLATDPTVRLFQPGDFLLHFAGVADQWNIYRMMRYILHCLNTRTSYNTKLLDNWYITPIKSKKDADLTTQNIMPN
jgi:hypothetical protein